MDGLGGFGNISPRLLDLAEDIKFTRTGAIGGPGWEGGIGGGVTTATKAYKASIQLMGDAVSAKPGILVMPEITLPLSTHYGGSGISFTVYIRVAFGLTQIGFRTDVSTPYEECEMNLSFNIYTNDKIIMADVSSESAPSIKIPRAVIPVRYPVITYRLNTLQDTSVFPNRYATEAPDRMYTNNVSPSLDTPNFPYIQIFTTSITKATVPSGLALKDQICIWSLPASFKWIGKLIPWEALL